MHRFESVHHLNRDTGTLYNSFSNPSNHPVSSTMSSPSYVGGGSSSLFRGSNANNMFPHIPNSGNRVYPPGSNPRLSCLLSSTPSASSPVVHHTEGGIYNSTYLNRQGPYNNGGTSAVQSRTTGNGLAVSSTGGQRPYPDMGFFGNGYGTVGGSGLPGNRYHPYGYQQHQQQQRYGFLEQLLKNRGIHQSGYPHYSTSRLSSSTNTTAAMGGNQFFPGGTYQQGYQNRGMMSGYHQHHGSLYGGGGGRPFASYHNQPYHCPQLQSVWGRGGGGVLYPDNYNHHVFAHNGGIHHPLHFHQQLDPHNMAIIKNEQEESTEEHIDQDVQKSEVRYRRNHERMHTILNETMANCDPIQVPMERVNSLRRHVRLLKEDVLKHKDDTSLVKETCAKRLQDFKNSTNRYHSDYSKLCQPISEEEYNKLVEKYYLELKAKLKQEQNVEAGAKREDGEEQLAFVKQENDDENSPASDSGRKTGSAAEKTVDDPCSNEVELLAVPDDDFFEHPLFIDIPNVDGEETTQQQTQVLPNLAEGFPTPPPLIPGGNIYYSEDGDGNQQQHQHRNLDYSYYSSPSTSCASTGGGNNGMGNLLMHAQPPPLQPQPSMRWHQGNNLATTAAIAAASSTRSCNSYGFPNQEYPSFLQQQQNTMRNSLPQNKTQRPSEQFHDFLLGWVRKLRDDNSTTIASNQVSDLQQEGGVQQAEVGGHFQQRRLMSGGGIVEVKQEDQPPATSNPEHEPLYDDAATREWINALASTNVNVTASSAEAEGIDSLSTEAGCGGEGEREEIENNNDNLQVDLNSELELVDSSSVTCTTSSNEKHPKISELLESPCLNEDSVEELESELRQQLEDALNAGDAEAESKPEENYAEDKEDDDDEENEDEFE